MRGESPPRNGTSFVLPIDATLSPLLYTLPTYRLVKTTEIIETACPTPTVQ